MFVYSCTSIPTVLIIITSKFALIPGREIYILERSLCLHLVTWARGEGKAELGRPTRGYSLAPTVHTLEGVTAGTGSAGRVSETLGGSTMINAGRDMGLKEGVKSPERPPTFWPGQLEGWGPGHREGVGWGEGQQMEFVLLLDLCDHLAQVTWQS